MPHTLHSSVHAMARTLFCTLPMHIVHAGMHASSHHQRSIHMVATSCTLNAGSNHDGNRETRMPTVRTCVSLAVPNLVLSLRVRSMMPWYLPCIVMTRPATSSHHITRQSTSAAYPLLGTSSPMANTILRRNKLMITRFRGCESISL